MEVYTTEEQQWDAIKAWFKKYANRISWLIIVALTIISSVKYWHHHAIVKAERAAGLYTELLLSQEQHDLTSMTSKAETLKKNYRGSIYNVLSGLQVAKHKFDVGDYVGAKDSLELARKNCRNLTIKKIIELRLAKILMVIDEDEAALKLLDKPTMYAELFYEMQGDIFLKQQKPDSAKAAYQNAVNYALKNKQMSPGLQMKASLFAIDIGDV